MTTPEINEKKKPILKNAIRGGLIFGIITTIIILGAFTVNGFLAPLYFFATVPGCLLLSWSGHLSAYPFGNAFLWGAYCILLNSLLGTLISLFFLSLPGFLSFLRKK